ncbi:MAG TPA: diguanylate cyclase [Longimicrobiales bacterium]|nr:diguanylate cyclase [Longimicrobiales bacterium]
MSLKSALVYHSARPREVPGVVRRFAQERGLRLKQVTVPDELVALVNRSFPALIVMDGGDDDISLPLCRLIKSDTFSAIVPVIFLLEDPAQARVLGCLEAGADEVLSVDMDEREQVLRLRMTLERADRDVSVNPTTRLPGTVQIARDISERLASGELFAVCYADIDHFKEFNDRYGYNHGDRIITILSLILRDVVKTFSPAGFIGHIGGDDFIFNVPLENMRACCEHIIEVFDELLPCQYSEEDRGRGYFLGKDRRGNVHRIPIMTLSIGVVTNQHRVFSHTARVSELASEMKTYAKTLSGSVFAVDRRRDTAEELEAAVADGLDGAGQEAVDAPVAPESGAPRGTA